MAFLYKLIGLREWLLFINRGVGEHSSQGEKSGGKKCHPFPVKKPVCDHASDRVKRIGTQQEKTEF